MKRVALVIVLVVIAGLAGIVRSHSRVHAYYKSAGSFL